YAVGGNVGFALGPVAVTALVIPFGISGIAWIALPMLVAATLLGTELPRLKRFRPGSGAGSAGTGPEFDPGFGASSGTAEMPVVVPDDTDPARDRWLPFSGVAAIAGFRSATYF